MLWPRKVASDLLLHRQFEDDFAGFIWTASVSPEANGFHPRLHGPELLRRKPFLSVFSRPYLHKVFHPRRGQAYSAVKIDE